MTVITIDAEVLEKEILESKVCTAYSTKNDSSQYVDYKSQGDTRLTINGSRHYKTPFGSLPSVTTILGATQGSKAALERWNKKNPGKKEQAARRGTAGPGRMEHYLLGEKDFSSFRASRCQSASAIRTVHQALFRQKGQYLVFEISANAFLLNMIRILVGTLIDVGKKEISIKAFQKIINSKKRLRCSVSHQRPRGQ